MDTPIFDKLKHLKKENRIPFHMPGHKRKRLPGWDAVTEMDITEIDGCDNLHCPEGIIRSSMDELKKVYGTRESWYLVNGSTVGILAAISAVCRPGDTILIGRNCHKAVYNAIRLLRLHAIYCYPQFYEEYGMAGDYGKEEREQIKNILARHREVRAVVLTSPTYEGVVSDIEKISAVTRESGAVLIVDEAHGAHFTFSDAFPKSAVSGGADLVIQSTHKTLPSFTQTALLHLCTDRVSPERIGEMLSIYETSSPSYLLLASAEYGAAFMHNETEKVKEYVDNLKKFRQKCGQLKKIRLLGKENLPCYDYDIGKFVFAVRETGMDGRTFSRKMLRTYSIEMEMANCSYCVAMTSVCDEAEDYERLYRALAAIDDACADSEDMEGGKDSAAAGGFFADGWKCPDEGTFSDKKEMEAWEALERETRPVEFREAAGRIAGEYVVLYPPGIPILVPGEKISKEMVENIRQYVYNGYNVISSKGRLSEKRKVRHIWTLREDEG